MSELILIASFIIIFAIQFLFCMKGKSRIIRMLPMIVFVFLEVVLIIDAQMITNEWDRLGHAIFMIFDFYMIVICGIAWGIWAIRSYLRNKKI